MQSRSSPVLVRKKHHQGHRRTLSSPANRQEEADGSDDAEPNDPTAEDHTWRDDNALEAPDDDEEDSDEVASDGEDEEAPVAHKRRHETVGTLSSST